jgi:dTMP kinase
VANNNNEGFVIALDGPDGVGKTTQVQLLNDYLLSKGYKVHTTRNSGGTPIGEELRKVSLANYQRPAETDMYISLAMGTALAEDIQKRKAAGEFVIIDRSPLAIIAYNGYGSEMPDKKPVFDACELLLKKYGLDLLVFLTAATSIIDVRRSQRAAKDFFENQNTAYHQRVREGYQAGLEYLNNHPGLCRDVETIDATPDIQTIHNSIVQAIEKQL